MTQYNLVTQSGGIFAEYINEFFKQKTEASGYPPERVTEDEKNEYIRNFERTEGIRLKKDNIKLNAGLRSVAKLCLNSLWGKLGQRENMAKTEVVTEAARLTELLTNAEVVVNGIIPVNDEVLYVNWQYQNDALVQSSTTSVVIAAFTTAQARLKLFKYLNELGPRALYYDTDSIFYVSKNGDHDLPISTMLGDLTDELPEKGAGTYISSFVSGGPKFYAYKYNTPYGAEQTVCKIKGIRLNYSTGEKINFQSIRDLISGDTNEIVLSSQAIRRTDFHDVLSLTETKTCKTVYGKWRFIGLRQSYPYGYKHE
jgi:hypothetical protein